MGAQKIDFHIHITPPEISKNWERFAESEPYFALLSKSPHNKFATAEDIVAMLEETTFSRAVIFGFGFNDLGLCRMANSYVIDSVNRFPDKLIGYTIVPPDAPGMEKEIERCHSAGLKGIGELFPEGQSWGIDNEKETRRLTDICSELHLPIIIHANEPVGHAYPGKTSVSLQKMERFVEHSQGLNVVLAHWGGGLFFFESMPEMRKKFCNVYYDVAATPFLYDKTVCQAAVALGLSEKILFGSDFPLLSPSRYLPAMESLPTPEKERILGGNAEVLLAG